MAENPNIVFSKEQLLERVWGYDFFSDVSTITVHIARIREKLDASCDGGQCIETVWGAGYRFKI